MKLKDDLVFINILKFFSCFIICLMYHYWEHGLVFNGGKIEDLFFNIDIINYITFRGFIFVELFFCLSGFLFFKKNQFISYSGTVIFFCSYLKWCINFFSKFSLLALLSSIVVYLCQLSLYNNNLTLWQHGGLSFLYSLQSFFIVLDFSSYQNMPLWFLHFLFYVQTISFIFLYFSKKLKSNCSLFLIPLFCGIFIRYNIEFFSTFISGCFFFHFSRALISFSSGILLCAFIQKYLHNKSFIFNVFLLFILCIISFIYMNASNEYYINLFFSDYCIFVSCILFPLLIIVMNYFCLYLKGSILNIFNYLGRLSLGLYVWNFPCLCFVHWYSQFFDFHFDYSSILYWLIFVFLNFGFAIISKYSIERISFKFSFLTKNNK